MEVDVKTITNLAVSYLGSQTRSFLSLTEVFVPYDSAQNRHGLVTSTCWLYFSDISIRYTRSEFFKRENTLKFGFQA